MENNILTQLTQIYNGLSTIFTRGEDTITMAICIQTLKQIIENNKGVE